MTVDDTWAAWVAYNAPDGRPAAVDGASGSITARIRSVAAAHPGRPAVHGVDGVIDYAELDRRADRVAAFLRGAGVAPGGTVAVAASRHVDPYVAVVGVLRAGCGFVPVDPRDPPHRLELICRDAEVSAVLARTAEVAHLPDLPGVPIGRLDADLRDAAEPTSSAPTDHRIPVDCPAYVLYTSGTTGTPKGVRVGEAGILNLLDCAVEADDVRPDSRLAQISPLTFDASMRDVFSALCTGACLLPVPEPERLDPVALLRWLNRNRVTHADTVPSHWRHVVAAVERDGSLGRLPHLRRLGIGGEDLRHELTRRWFAAVRSPARLVNIYGPTETTIFATWWPVDPAGERGPVPIGVPVRNCRVYVVDDRDTVCPPGTTGEILIAGLGVALGYQSPEATRRSFVGLTLPDGRIDRCYRTGDLGRLVPAPSGWVLEYLGRGDTQVKVRGFRVDLREVEAIVATAPGVRDAAAAVLGDSGQLGCGYTGDVDAVDVRAFAATRLAAHQVPDMVVRLDQLPLTRNGKRDRAGLTQLLTAALAARTPTGTKDATATERLVAEVWCDVLGLGRVGVDEDFFTVGGTSLLVLDLVRGLRERGLPVGPAEVFAHPTVAGLAAVAGR